MHGETAFAFNEGGYIQNDVVVGTDGHMFLAQGNHHVLDYITGRRSIADASFAAFEKNILARRTKCLSMGAQYQHIVFPDKQSALLASFPLPNTVCLSDLYAAACPQSRDYVLNLGDMLRKTPGIYKKTDTHLNDIGCAISAARVATLLTGKDQNLALDALLSKPRTSRHFVGDLGKRTVPVAGFKEEFITADWAIHQFSNEFAGNDGMVEISLSPQAIFDRRILWFGDSFGRDCIKFLTYFFSQIVFLRTRFFHEEMASQIKPDIVVTQQVERYMASISSDDEATPFLLYPALKGAAYTPSVAFARAFSAVMSYPRPPYVRFMSEHGNS